jgi:cell division septation protein DedD
MGDIFDEKEFRPAEYRPDTELTLGPAVLVSLLLGFLLLCGFCFWKGYSMGIRAAQAAPPATQQPCAQAAAPAAGSLHKPLAAPQAVSPPKGGVGSQSLPGVSSASPAGVWMVQIATVSHQEDADVLVAALRRRGYAVTVRRDHADNMFHVQVGPFSSPGDANAMRQKLLNDGYNASVQP